MEENKNLTRTKGVLSHRQRAYQAAFDEKHDYTKLLLEDLKKFCRAEASTFNADPRLHALLEGRREVWLRIMDHLNLSPQQLWDKYYKGEGPI